MKLNCNGVELSDAISKVIKAVGTKQLNPVLEGIKLTATKGSLNLLATDTLISIETSIEADVAMEGQVVVLGKYFADFVKKLDKQAIELSVVGDKLKIRYAESDTSIQTLNVDEFPLVDKKTEGSSFTINQKEFRDLVNKTAFACSNDGSRPILQGCLLEIRDGTITSVALDGYRMAVAKKPITATAEQSIVCPQRALIEICRILEKDDADITIVFKKKAISVESSNTHITAQLLEGDFIDYKRIIPQEFATTLTADKQKLAQSIERAAVFAKQDRYSLVKMDIKEEMIVSSASEIGSVNEKVEISKEGKDIQISLNSKFITDAIKAAGDDYIKIKFNSAVAPCIITPVKDDEYLYLILPVRT